MDDAATTHGSEGGDVGDKRQRSAGTDEGEGGGEACDAQEEKKARTSVNPQAKSENGEGKEGGEEASDKTPKRMVAVQLGYVGSKYSGLQKNPGQETIEAELEKAIHAAGFIHDCNFGHQQKVHWSRAARTDKGVHALGNAVALKILMPPEQSGAQLAASINTHLPTDIKVLDVKRATKSFNAKLCASGRVYHYLLPTFALQPREPPAESEQAQQKAEREETEGEEKGEERKGYGKGWKKESFWETSSYAPSASDLAAARAYRAPPELRQQLDAVLSKMQGTHSFHNYTSGKSAAEASSKRFVVSFKAAEIAVHGDLEFVELQIQGQSFMIHQIRKMVGAAVLVLRYGLDATASLQATFRSKKVHVPTAPATGLLLGKVLFTNYNRLNKHLNPLDFEDLQEQMQSFKRERVYPEIVRREAEEHCTLRWLDELHTFYATWL